MTRFKQVFIVKLILIIICAIAGSILVSCRYYWLGAAICLVMIWASTLLYSWAMRSLKDIKRYVDAIQYTELNISFQKATKKGLPQELAVAMENSLSRFRDKLINTETEYLFYDTMLQRIDSGIMVIDKQGSIKWINKAAIDVFGRPQPHHLKDLEAVSPGLPGMIERLAPEEIKLLRIHHGNTENQFAVTVTFFSTQGKSLKLVSLKDIRPALESNESEAWRKLIRVLTHEMMNSITPIISLAETLSEAPGTVDERQYASMSRAMQTIHRRSKGLVDFVKNYQQLTRIPEPVMTEIPVTEMLADIDRLLRADGIIFSYQVVPENIRLIADRTQMEQVLINLVKNAWEASLEQPDPKVSIHVFRNDYQKPVIEVSDNGYGIVSEVIDKVFVPFFTTKAGGSGIGLSICRQIMNMHQGFISIDSEVDKGTKITLHFT